MGGRSSEGCRRLEGFRSSEGFRSYERVRSSERFRSPEGCKSSEGFRSSEGQSAHNHTQHTKTMGHVISSRSSCSGSPGSPCTGGAKSHVKGVATVR